ncbi:MAG: helix-turn-helix domain-containing protein [Lachnospiraceae bacterium]|nr:helix-turn-helix domain-containing protein [Lachnospiraceae bacterium]
MEYLSIKQTSEKWGVSTRRIQVLCSEDRIPGATKIGSYWAIPVDAEKPKDERVKNGKYMKSADADVNYKSIKKYNDR